MGGVYVRRSRPSIEVDGVPAATAFCLACPPGERPRRCRPPQRLDQLGAVGEDSLDLGLIRAPGGSPTEPVEVILVLVGDLLERPALEATEVEDSRAAGSRASVEDPGSGSSGFGSCRTA